jgi:hypothetical protein
VKGPARCNLLSRESCSAPSARRIQIGLQVAGRRGEARYQEVQERPNPRRHVPAALIQRMHRSIWSLPLRHQDGQAPGAQVSANIPDRFHRDAMPGHGPLACQCTVVCFAGIRKGCGVDLDILTTREPPFVRKAASRPEDG